MPYVFVVESIHQSLFFINQQTESEQVQQNVDKGKKDKKKQAAALNAGKVWDLYEKFCSCVLMWHHESCTLIWFCHLCFCYSLVSGTCFKGIKDHSKFDILHWNVWKISDSTVKKIQGNVLYIGILLNVHAHVLLNYTQIYLYHRYFLCLKKGSNTGSMLLGNF